MKKVNWFDCYGFLHLRPDPGAEQSENGVLFTAIYYKLLQLEQGALTQDQLDKLENSLHWLEVRKGVLRNTPVTKHTGISHDNYTAIASMYYSFFPEKLSLIEIVNKRRLHPRDLIYYGYLHNRWWAKLLLPLCLFTMVLSCFQNYKVRGGNKILKTDGKQLAFLRCHAAGFKRTLAVCTWLIKKNKMFRSWENVFFIYYRRADHPIVKLASKLVI